MSELPKGWTLTDLSIAGKWGSGGTPKRHNKDYYDGEIPWLVIGDLNDGIVTNSKNSITEQGLQNSSAKLVDKGTLLIAMYGSIGKLGIAGFKCSTNQAIAHCSVNTTLVNSQYLFYYLRSRREHLLSIGKGGAQQNISQTVLKAYELPLAPINEQVRIADKLDSILAKVNKAQSRLDKIPVILKRFRQSVLVAATSGDLTKEWREENDITLSEWEETVFSELSREITVGFVGKMSDKYQSEGVKFLRSQNVRAFKFDAKNLLYIPTEFHEKIYKSRLEAGDLAVVRSGAPGTTCVIPDDLGDANCSDLVIVRPNEKLISEFGCIYMNSSVAQKNVKDNQVGVAQQHFNVGSMKLMPISLPTKAEQSEIVRRVHSLFALAEAVEKNYKDSNVKVNRLTQSLLAKAFRGELVPQEPNDEPAEKLLSRIQSELEKKPKDIVKRTTKKSVVKNMKLEDAPENYLKNLMPSDESEIQAKELWQDSKMTIDDFYAQLKKELINIEEINNSLDPNARTLKALKE